MNKAAAIVIIVWVAIPLWAIAVSEMPMIWATSLAVGCGILAPGDPRG